MKKIYHQPGVPWRQLPPPDEVSIRLVPLR